MKIYKCAITGDELFSDIYPMELIGCVWEVKGCLKTEQQQADFDIGANPSAEGGDDEGVDSASAKTGIDIVIDNRLEKAPPFTKKDYAKYLKGYMKIIRENLRESDPDRVDKFEKDAQEFVKKLMVDKKRFSELDFYTGESCNPDGHIALLEWRDDGATPVMMFYKDGLIEEKV